MAAEGDFPDPAMRSGKVERIVRAGVLAAAYTALTVALAPISFGNVQCRIAEALTVLAVFGWDVIGGLTLGCFLSNLIGAALGTNVLGFADALIGTSATLLAGWLSWRLRSFRYRGIPLLSALMPVLCNGIFVGAELAWLEGAGGAFWRLFAVFSLEVALGEAVSVFAIGVPLERALEKRMPGKEKG